MKINQSKFAKKLNQLKSVVSGRNTDGNQGVLLKGNTLMANNYEIGLTVSTDADADVPFIIPPKAIDMIDSLSGEIDLDVKDGKIIVKSDNGTSRFVTIPAENFCEVNALASDSEVHVCDAQELETALAKVTHACSASDSKPELQGVLLEGDGEYLNIVACDGCRLAWNRIKYDKKIYVIIPKDTLKKAFSIKFSGDLTLRANANNAVIESGDYAVYTRLFGDNYIKYQNMFAETPNTFMIDRREFLESICRSQICLDGKIKTPVVLKGEGNILNISVKSSLSEFSEDIRLNASLPSNIEIAINGAFLTDALKSFDEETVEVQYTTDLKPMAFIGETLKALVVPVRRT